MTGPAWTCGGEPEAQTGVLRWRAMGEGPPLVLLHKLGGWIAEWEAMAKALPDRRVIAIDLPGHGGGYGQPPYAQRHEDSTARVLATLEAIGVDRFALGGSSLGGSVAVSVAAAAGQRLQGLVLISVALTRPSTMEGMQAADRKANDALFGPDNMPIDRSVEQTTSLFGLSDPALSQDMNDSRRAAGLWVRPSYRGTILADVRGKLPAIAAPALLIYGQNGPGYGAYEQVGLSELSDARSLTVPGASAFTHQDHPDETARAIEAFLS